MKTDLFQSCGHCCIFQICWHNKGSTFTVSSFRIWNSSTGIPSPPLTLFIVLLPKAHLTSHSRMSGSRWVITPSWLSGSWRSFLYISSVYSCHLFLISSASVIPFLSFIEPIFAWNVPLVSLIFLRSLVCPIVLFSSISLHLSLRKACYSLKLCIQMRISFLLSSWELVGWWYKSWFKSKGPKTRSTIVQVQEKRDVSFQTERENSPFLLFGEFIYLDFQWLDRLIHIGGINLLYYVDSNANLL